MPKDPNEVGAAWKKESERGKYLSIALDIDALLELTGGTTGKVNLSLYPIDFEKSNANSPDYRLKFYPRHGGVATQRRVAAGEPARRPDAWDRTQAPRNPPPPPTDDDIPFDRPVSRPVNDDDDGLGVPAAGAIARRRLAREKGHDDW